MKKIIIALMLLGAICANTFAQEYDIVEAGEEIDLGLNDEVYLSVGSISGINILGTMFAAIFSFGQFDPSENSMPVTFTGGYNHYFCDNHLGVGGMISYENVFGNNFFTGQAKITGQYGWEHFKLYHSLSLGLAMMDSEPFFAFDITFLGLKLDFENFNIFFETAGPMTGLVKIGASYKF